MASGRSSIRFALIFVGIWSFVTLIFDGYIAINLARQIGATNFHETQGVITFSDVSRHKDSDGDTMYNASLKYTYRVSEQVYTGDRYAYGDMSSSSHSRAADIVAAHPVGAPVTVYFKASDPAESTLRQGIERSLLFMMVFMTPFNLVTLGGWAMLARAIRKRNDTRICAGFLRSDDGTRATLLFNRVPPIGIAAGAMGGVSFASIFLVGFTTGFEPPPIVLAATFLMIGIGGVVGYIHHRRRIARGDFTLVIDRTAWRVQLPRRKQSNEFAMAEENEVPFDRVASIQTPIDRQREINDRATYQLHLILNGQQATGPIILAKWLNIDDAGAAAAWLRSELGVPESAT